MTILSNNYGSMKAMKKWAVCAVLLLACLSVNAQNFNFEKLAKIKGVEYTHVDKEKINLAASLGEGLHIGESVNLGGGDDAGKFLQQLDDVKVFSCEEKGSIKKFKKTALDLLKGQEWEPLVDTTGDDGEMVKIYLSKNGEYSTNVILAVEDDEANLVVISGTFDLAKMMQQAMNKNGEVNE